MRPLPSFAVSFALLIRNEEAEDSNPFSSTKLFKAGRSAVPALKRFLRETRPAPLFGSKEYVLAQQLKYRLCDYALFFLKRIDGDAQFTLPPASEQRDALIKKAQN